MNETLVGVIVGGIIASITSVIVLIVEYKKWKIGLQINHLRDRREKLKQLFKSASEAIVKGMIINRCISMLSDIDFLVPDAVRDTFEKFMYEKDKTPEKMRSHNYGIQCAMKKSLSQLDDEIDLIVKASVWHTALAFWRV